MRSVIRLIDRSIKKLYYIDPGYRAEDFLIGNPPNRFEVGGLLSTVKNACMQGALFVSTDRTNAGDLSVGIYLEPSHCDALKNFSKWKFRCWSKAQLQAFTVAVEEVSHFQYLVYHILNQRPVTHLELELQGEIDKFLLSYFAYSAPSKQWPESFVSLYEQLFINYSLEAHLSDDSKQRYLEANRLARQLVMKLKPYLETPKSFEKALGYLRKLYRLNTSDKISFIAGLD